MSAIPLGRFLKRKLPFLLFDVEMRILIGKALKHLYFL